MPEIPRPDELDDVIALIAAQQPHPDRNIGYLGTEPDGIAAELDGLEPPWATTARVIREGGRITGAIVAEWDAELGRSWIIGPWVDADGEAWSAAARQLVDAALAQLPDTVEKHELFGDLANERLAELGAALGWQATEVNHALVADSTVVGGWPTPADHGRLRAAIPADVDAIQPLHDIEFPSTYASAAQLVEGQRDGSRVVLVAEDADRIVGYAAGEVHEDGEGFIDFVAVEPEAQGRGVGQRLVVALTRQLVERSTNGRVCLTVQDHRTPARALYERLGFRHEAALVGYRSWPQDA